MQVGITLSIGLINSGPDIGGDIPRDCCYPVGLLAIGAGSNAPLLCFAANKVS